MTKTRVKKTKSKKDHEIEFLSEQNVNNTIAMRNGPQRKKFSTHDLKVIKPLTTSQKMMFESFFMGNHIVAAGSAGTGKSFCALYLALNDLLSKDTNYEKIIIVRSIVQVSDIGFLPGSIEDKIAPYEMPYQDIVKDLIKSSHAYDTLKENYQLEFLPTSFIRGLTWDNAIVIFDEIQNAQDHEINSVFTRIGNNSKMIVCGDKEQNDLLNRKYGMTSGYDRFINTVQKMESVDVINFTEADIVRSDFVKEWIVARNHS